MSEPGPTDRYAGLVSHRLGAQFAAKLGLPQPVTLRRYDSAELVLGPVVVAGHGPAAQAARTLIAASGAVVLDAADGDARLGGLVVDVTAATSLDDLRLLHAMLAGAVKRLLPSGRVIIIGLDPTVASTVESAAVHRGLEGLVRSLGKELRRGATANLVCLSEPSAEVASPLGFLLSGRSAYVAGQRLTVRSSNQAEAAPAGEVDRPLAGRVAIVTGAARGIGAATVRVLSRAGARVIAVDVPAAGQALADVANEVAGVAVQLDITSVEAGRRLVDSAQRLGGLDIVVHNAGITRDRLLVNLDQSQWASVLEVNLAAQLRIDDILLGAGSPLRPGARFVAVSSMSGIAGNRGQTNYATSKAGVIGMVQRRAADLAGTGTTYNAVAPGFIETEMTARMPLGPRELGRRLNSLAQGGRPIDVAETIAFFAEPGSGGLTGQVLRVCGQSLLGA